MMRSVIAAVGLMCLTASAAAAQITNNYWLAAPPATIGSPPKPPPPPEIPNVPFAAAHNVQVAAAINIDKDFKPIGPFAPLWLGSDAVALLGTHHGQVTLRAWEGDRFAKPRVIADPSTVEGGTILDMAVSRDGKRLAIAAAGGDKLQIWLRDTHGSAPAAVAATIDAAAEKAGIAWLDADTLAVGAQMQPSAAQPSDELPILTPGAEQTPGVAAEPAHKLYVVQLGAPQQPATLELECIQRIGPTTLIWSPDGHYAVAQSEEQRNWILIDRAKSACAAIVVPGIFPAGFIGWDDKSRGFLLTAAPAGAPDPGHIGVMEYTLASHKARLLASPATAAAYLGGGKIAVLGSRRLNAAAVGSHPDALFPAEIAWIDPGQSRVEIVPTGFTATAAELLRGHLSYSAAKGLLAAGFQTPHPKGAFSVLLWLSAAAHNGGVVGTGRMGTMLASWSPDGGKLAVLAGLPEHPTLAIVTSPQ